MKKPEKRLPHGDGPPMRQFLCESRILEEVIPFCLACPDVKSMYVFSEQDAYACCYQVEKGTEYTEYALFPAARCEKNSALHGIAVGFYDFDASRMFLDQFNECFGTVLNGFYSGGTIDIVPAGVSKSSGIAALAEILNIKKENIFSVGDSYNDLPMLEAFHGYVVEGAPLDLREKIGRTVKNVESLIYKLSE